MTATYRPAEPIWCAGCGHFGVEAALIGALADLDVPKEDTLVLAGIGCSGTIQNNMGTYGYHALHGRVLPTATGAWEANPDLTVIAAGGDGDGYAIGMGHLIHTFRRNPAITYIVMNNGIYGLTKGQNSPTRQGTATLDAYSSASRSSKPHSSHAASHAHPTNFDASPQPPSPTPNKDAASRSSKSSHHASPTTTRIHDGKQNTSTSTPTTPTTRPTEARRSPEWSHSKLRPGSPSG